jgi:hypothetical protein
MTNCPEVLIGGSLHVLDLTFNALKTDWNSAGWTVATWRGSKRRVLCSGLPTRDEAIAAATAVLRGAK